jgi:hypothetical protein
MDPRSRHQGRLGLLGSEMEGCESRTRGFEETLTAYKSSSRDPKLVHRTLLLEGNRRRRNHLRTRTYRAVLSLTGLHAI